MGYFSPGDCQHDDGSGDDTITPCEYKKYPEWDGLVEVYAKSDAKIVRTQNPGAVPACPGRFQPLSFYDWPTDEEKDSDLEYCLELKKNEDAATEKPTRAPTKNPTASPDDERAATDFPTTIDEQTATPDGDISTAATDDPSMIPTTEPTGNQTAQCSFHPVCSLSGLAGACCPTLDGVILGCCDNFEVSSAHGVVFYHYLLVVSGLAVMLASW